MTGLIILAAGPSTRLGKSKQLLQYKGESLIRRAVRTGAEAGCDPIIVVLGANSEKIETEIDPQTAHVVNNIAWEEGMGSSIRTGLSKLLKLKPQIEEMIIMLCDQPFADSALLKKLIRKRSSTGKEIVACEYGDTVGVPVLYSKICFPELLALKGDQGAKKLLLRHQQEVTTVSFPEGIIDIDTAEDYEALQ